MKYVSHPLLFHSHYTKPRLDFDSTTLLYHSVFIMFKFLNSDTSGIDFIKQQYEYANNFFINWMIVGCVFTVLLATILTPYLAVIPKSISSIHINGYQLSKFGFILLTLGLLYAMKALIAFFFYLSISDGKRWQAFSFVATKYYFLFSLMLFVILVLQNYFAFHWQGFTYTLDYENRMEYLYLFLLSIFLIKNIIYLFNKNEILPQKWYYKILYICTLQFAPILVLWKLFLI